MTWRAGWWLRMFVGVRTVESRQHAGRPRRRPPPRACGVVRVVDGYVDDAAVDGLNSPAAEADLQICSRMGFEPMETLTLEKRDGIAVVLLDRPPVNAVNHAMRVELKELFDELSQDREVGAVVLGANGDRAFSAGVDLREMKEGRPSGPDLPIETTLDPGWEWRRAQHAVRHCSVPVIGAVEGVAIGAGFGLVGVCDLIIASTSAKFALTEINVGLLGGASKAFRLVGPHKARMMMFSGQIQSAEEFYRLGAIEQLVEPGQALDAAVDLAKIFASKSPLAMRLAKESILRIEGDETEIRYRTEQDYTTRLKGFNDSKEAMSAFLEKRDPEWTWS